MTDKTDKSDLAFRTISEVADHLELPQHVLRFWETKFRQVSPLKRGGGRRYYRPQDVDLLRRIKSLLHTEGYTIKGVQRMLSQGGVKNLPPVTENSLPASSTPPENAAVAHHGDGERVGEANVVPSFDLGPVVQELEEIRDHLSRGLKKISMI